MASRNVLKSYFQTGDFPTQEQFAELIDSFWHLEEDGEAPSGPPAGQIDLEDVEGLQAALEGKADSDHSHDAATPSAAGFMSAADKSKLNAIAAGATANSSDVHLLSRQNHTGEQAIATITGLQAALNALSTSLAGLAIGNIAGLQDALNALSGAGSGVQVVAVPSTATAPGTVGHIASDSEYFYVCIATNSWLRCPIMSW